MSAEISGLIKDFYNFLNQSSEITPIGYVAILRTEQMTMKKRFLNRDDAREYVWINSAILFLCSQKPPVVLIEQKSKKIVAASDNACNLLNKFLIGLDFAQFSSWEIERENITSPTGNKYAFLKLSPKLLTIN